MYSSKNLFPKNPRRRRQNDKYNKYFLKTAKLSVSMKQIDMLESLINSAVITLRDTYIGSWKTSIVRSKQ